MSSFLKKSEVMFEKDLWSLRTIHKRKLIIVVSIEEKQCIPWIFLFLWKLDVVNTFFIMYDFKLKTGMTWLVTGDPLDPKNHCRNGVNILYIEPCDKVSISPLLEMSKKYNNCNITFYMKRHDMDRYENSDKIAEEVKSSPQRIQQVTQTVTEKIRTATNDDSFFSIAEDDASNSHSTSEHGFSNVSLSNYFNPQSDRIRKNSNCSVASDMSFLPQYESSSNLYHLQSDLDVSASEVEDNASTSSQLGHLSKEQIYAAFQKAQLRYHKYRGRYTDIANHYRELEKENGKIKSILEETQDKALRRVAELREQSLLEQKAKAHLENALRLELDEKQYVIDSLKTKVDLLQSTKLSQDHHSDLLVSISDDTLEKSHPNLEILTNDLRGAQTEIENLNERLQEMKANAIIFNSKETDLKKKVHDLEESIKQKISETSTILERERENNLIIAQTKIELHNEIQNRDLEIENLKQDVKTLKTDLEQYETKNRSGKFENLQSQNANLIDKIETLMKRCKSYESELLKLEQTSIENQTKLKERDIDILSLQDQIKQKETNHEKDIAAHRENTKQHLFTLETKIREKIEAEFKDKEKELQVNFEDKLCQLTTNDNNIKEIQVKLLNKEDEIKKLMCKMEELSSVIQTKTDKYNELECNHLELITENAETLNQIKSISQELGQTKETYLKSVEEKKNLDDVIAKLGSEIDIAQKRLNDLESIKQRLEIENANLSHNLENQLLGYQEKVASLENTQANLLRVQDENLELQNEIKLLKNIEETFHRDVTNLKHENAALNTENQKVNQQILQSEKSLAQFQEEIKLLTDSNEKLQNGVNDLSKKENKLREDEIKFHKEIQRLNEEISNFKDENETIKDSIDNYKQKLSEYEVQLSHKATDLEVLKSNNDTLQVRNLELLKNVENLVANLKENEEEKSSLKLNVQRLTDEIILLKNEITEQKHMVAENVSIKQRMEELNNDIEMYKDIFSKYEKHQFENAQLVTSSNELRNDIAKYEIVKSDLEKEIWNLKTTNEEEKNKLNERISEQTLIASQLEIQVIDLQNIVKDLRSTEQDKKALEESYLQLKNELQNVIIEKQQQENTYKELTEANQQTLDNHVRSLEEISELRLQNEKLSLDLQQVAHENVSLSESLAEANLKCDAFNMEKTKCISIEKDNAELCEELNRIKLQIAEVNESENCINENKKLKLQLHSWETKCETYEKEKKDLENQLRELENQFTEIMHERQFLQDEIQELKVLPVNTNNNLNFEMTNKHISINELENVRSLQEEHEKEVDHLNEKIMQYKSLDLTNRTSIQFYENELQKLRNKNEKLNRKLDETLVTLSHCTELSTSTETEYLKNVLYNYMLGKESLILARVIAAVCKFDDGQTEAILQREQQKQTLLGQLGFR
ncbi:hypothetical protein FQA39_LY07828 [Lamprigera yunnana]|nr:hypothetical protein FQA39_LY07828 [Lamprigera yunnana]